MRMRSDEDVEQEQQRVGAKQALSSLWRSLGLGIPQFVNPAAILDHLSLADRHRPCASTVPSRYDSARSRWSGGVCTRPAAVEHSSEQIWAKIVRHLAKMAKVTPSRRAHSCETTRAANIALTGYPPFESHDEKQHVKRESSRSSSGCSGSLRSQPLGPLRLRDDRRPTAALGRARPSIDSLGPIAASR